MFESLKNKLKSWLGKPQEEEKPKKKEKKKAKELPKSKKPVKKKIEEKKKTPKIKETASKKAKDLAVKEAIKENFEQEIKQTEEDKNIVEVKQEPAPLEPQLKETQEKQGFFSRMFGKKKEEPKIEEEKKEIIEQEQALEKPDESIKVVVQEESKGFFSKISSKFTTSIVTKEQVDEIFQDLEIILLENNVALEVVDKIKENLIKDLVGISVKKSEIDKTVIESLKESINSVLIEPPNLIEQIKRSLDPYTIIFFGINGTGKTTSIAKVAHLLKNNGISCVLVAADTFRAAAIEQLETHANKLKIPIIKSEYNSDPTSVAFEAKKYAQANKIQCILIDTAGRMYTKENLIKQMEKMIRVIKPDLKVFVGESITGNDAIEQAKTFNEAVGIDGIILSKADVDEKGGTALSVSYVTGKPIYFLGTGQSYDDLEIFSKDKILKNLGLD